MTHNDIEQALRDYFWMVKEVNRITEEMKYVEGSMTAMYGIEASMPKGGGTTDKVGKTVARRIEESAHQRKLQGKIDYIEKGLSTVSNDLHRSLMLCMMDGLSLYAISRHLQMSEGKVNSLKNKLIDSLMNNEENERYEEIGKIR